MRRGVGAHPKPLGGEERLGHACRRRLAVRADDVDRAEPELGVSEARQELPHPPQPELLGPRAQRLEPDEMGVSRRAHRARAGTARASRARPRPPRPGRSRRSARSTSIPSERATSFRSRATSSSRLPFTGSLSGWTTMSKTRFASPSSSTTTPLRRAMAAASRTRSSASRSAAKRSSGSGHGVTISRLSRAGKLGPDLLGHVRHHRVQQREQPLERRESRRRGVRVVLVEPRLRRLRVPVAEVVEGEAVELLHGRGEVEPRPGPLDLRAGRVEPRQDPALLERPRPRVRLGAFRVRQDEASHVPELGRELASLDDRAFREAHVLRRGHLQEPVARRVGAVLRDQLERVDARPEALRHPPAVGREHRRVDDHVM